MAQISFTLKTFQSVIIINDAPVNVWFFAAGIIAFYSPLAWVRSLKYFSPGYMLGCVMIIYTVLVVEGYSITGLINSGS